MKLRMKDARCCGVDITSCVAGCYTHQFFHPSDHPHTPMCMPRSVQSTTRRYCLWDNATNMHPSDGDGSGMTYHRQTEVQPHRQHHARRPPLASGTTTYPVQAEYVSQQMPSSQCTVVPRRHVHPGVNSIWSLMSTVVLTL